MNRLALIALLATAAAGAQAQTFVDNARVRSVEPQYESVTVPRNECTSQWINETRRVSAGPNYGGLAIGGVAGALLGNQVGRGHGREAATAVGAVVGALAGDRLGRRDSWDRYEDAPREVTNCHAVNDVQTRLAGYRVSYEYHGQMYTTLTRENPGSALPVRVSVEPMAR